MTKYEYRAAATVVAVSGTAPFFEFKHTGAASVRIKRIIVSGPSTATGIEVSVLLIKNSAALTGGTPAAMTAVPLDSGAPTSIATLQAFTAAPTAGAAVGNIGARRLAAVNTATPVTESTSAVFDFDGGDLVLRSSTECCTLAFGAAPGGATTLGIEVAWTEEA